MKELALDHQEVTDRLRALTDRYQVAHASVLTRSILGRDIPLITLGNGKHAVLYVGAHHGTDGMTAGILLDFIADYLEQRERGATVYGYPMKYLFEERRIYIVPMLNPDGVDYAVHGVQRDNPLYHRVLNMEGAEDFKGWKANARGVDLHHNYEAGFFEYRKERPKQTGAALDYGGEFPESEPETAALARFLRLQREEIVGVLSLHLRGKEIICSCGDHLSAKTMAVGRVLSRMTGYRLVRPEGVSAFGSLSDWCITKLGRPAYTVRCGARERTSAGDSRSLLYERLRRILFSFPCII